MPQRMRLTAASPSRGKLSTRRSPRRSAKISAGARHEPPRSRRDCRHRATRAGRSRSRGADVCRGVRLARDMERGMTLYEVGMIWLIFNELIVLAMVEGARA